MSKHESLSHKTQPNDTTTTLTRQQARGAPGWLRLPPELRLKIYDLVVGSAEVECCPYHCATCESENTSRPGCQHHPFLHCHRIPDLRTLLNPRLNMMLVSKQVLEDVNSLKPPVPLIAFFPHPTCVAQRLHAHSKPALLRSISMVVVKDKMYISKQDWPHNRDVYYDNAILVHDANLWRLLREFFSDVRQIEDKETLDKDEGKDHVVVEHETAYEVSKVKGRS